MEVLPTSGGSSSFWVHWGELRRDSQARRRREDSQLHDSKNSIAYITKGHLHAWVKALDCLHLVLRLQLGVHVANQALNHAWDNLEMSNLVSKCRESWIRKFDLKAAPGGSIWSSANYALTAWIGTGHKIELFLML
ncbi:hypothetical protein VNO77_19725 [Canavalia gladiata]|uniref:Uncharacterized protein n=1 Tax=Canavalia gladiata TaxID=3824 RepID=A0AAN9LS31_CANGL